MASPVICEHPEFRFNVIQAMRSPSARADQLVKLAPAADEGLFKKIVSAITGLDAVAVGGFVKLSDCQEATAARPPALQALFSILMEKKEYEKAFEFVPNVRSPLKRAEMLIKLADVCEASLFEKIVVAIETLDAMPLREGYVVGELQEAGPARIKARQHIFELFVKRYDYERAFNFVQKNLKDSPEGDYCLIKLAELAKR